jgi:(4-(4-[2-(gamma-L-glutamylamino)ethyl]phenoxymethyl)furan-2-yl)methanamine synthase
VAVVIGWDIGGAHLKGARLEAGKITATAQVPCPLWLGLERLDNAFTEAQSALAGADRHAMTMTGELADAFASRPEGVQKLTAVARRMLAGDLLVYAGRAGFVDAQAAASHVEDIASANWHATASFIGRLQGDGLLVDIGSTTTDLIPIVGGSVRARGYSDAQRLASAELVYTGLGLMNENFANAGDLYRILERLPDGVDQHATADGREKTVPNSVARLARMVGREAGDLSHQQWVLLAQWFAEAQLRKLTDAAMLILSRPEIPTTLPVIMAGIGDTIVAELARRLRRPLKEFTDGLNIAPAAAVLVRQCAPAVSVAYLAGAPG